MRIDGVSAIITLEREQSLRIEAGVRVLVTCGSGVLWITQAGDARDLFLSPGERLMLAPRGLMLVTALEPSGLAVHDVRGAAALTRTLPAWLRRARLALRGLAPPPRLVRPTLRR